MIEGPVNIKISKYKEANVTKKGKHFQTLRKELYIACNFNTLIFKREPPLYKAPLFANIGEGSSIICPLFSCRITTSTS